MKTKRAISLAMMVMLFVACSGARTQPNRDLEPLEDVMADMAEYIDAAIGKLSGSDPTPTPTPMIAVFDGSTYAWSLATRFDVPRDRILLPKKTAAVVETMMVHAIPDKAHSWSAEDDGTWKCWGSRQTCGEYPQYRHVVKISVTTEAWQRLRDIPAGGPVRIDARAPDGWSVWGEKREMSWAVVNDVILVDLVLDYGGLEYVGEVH